MVRLQEKEHDVRLWPESDRLWAGHVASTESAWSSLGFEYGVSEVRNEEKNGAEGAEKRG